MDEKIAKQYDQLKKYICSLKRVLVAYSGGVDSTLLLAAVIDTAIDHLAVTAYSPTMPQTDYQLAQEMAQQLKANHRLIQSGEMENPNFYNNPINRCYYCKSDLFARLLAIAKKENYYCVVDGSNQDDMLDYRPGMQAKNELHIYSPLLELGLHKEQIRQLSHFRGLKTWDKPSSPCLSSRFPYGERITIEALQRIDVAENYLKSLGFSIVRVRKDGDTAKIEVPEADIPTLAAQRHHIVDHFLHLGFKYIMLDLEGFESGKLNRIIPVKTV